MPSIIPLDNSLGAALIGVVISTVIYGITCLQTYLYYTQYSGKDRWGLKTLVGTVWVLDTLHVALITTSLYHYTVTNWGDLLTLLKTTWSLEIEILFGAMLTSIVQLFFAQRIWILSHKNIYLTGAIIFLSIVQTAFSVAFMGYGMKVQYFMYVGQPTNMGLAGTGMAADIACDLTITVAMCYYLHKSRTGFKGTNRLINLLIIYTIRTGLLTSIVAITGLVLFLIYPETLIFVCLYFIIIKLYTNSLLTILNSRDELIKNYTSQGEIMSVSRSPNYNGSASTGTIVFATPGPEKTWRSDAPSDEDRKEDDLV